MSILKEFRDFTVKGNFIDLAVGVIIGAASGKVVSSLVEKVIMPPISLATGRVNFADLKVVLQPAAKDAAGADVKEIALGYGSALQSFLELLIIAFVVFLVVRIYNRFRAAAAAAEPPAQEKLLTEIRDLLKEQKKTSS